MSLQNPTDRKQAYLNRIATGEGEIPEYPADRYEAYLAMIAKNGAAGDKVYTKEEVDNLLRDKADLSDIPSSLPADGGNADTVNSHTVDSDVPENAVFTDTLYDDSDIRAAAAANAAAIDTLNGTGEGSVEKKVNDRVAEIVADAPEDFDTLKEMSDWIASHQDDASAMNSAILDNAAGIESLEQSKADSADLAGIATSGEWDDVNNKPFSSVGDGLSVDNERLILTDKQSYDKAVSKSAENYDTLGCSTKNIFDFKKFKNSLNNNGLNVQVTKTDDKLICVNTSTPAYTIPYHPGSSTVYLCPVEPNTEYIMTWECNNEVDASILIFYYEDKTPYSPGRPDGRVSINAKEIELKTTSTTHYLGVRLDLNSANQTLEFFKPMLRNANVTDDSYEPYTLSVNERFENLGFDSLDPDCCLKAVDNKLTEDIQIGGTNLLKNSYNLSLWDSKIEPTEETYRGKKVFKNNKNAYLNTTVNLPVGTIFTYSIMLRIDKIDDVLKPPGNLRMNGSGFQIIKESFPMNNLDETWKRYVVKCRNTTETFSIYPYLSSAGRTGDYWYMCMPELEIGDKPTDWSPAPEDLIYKSDKVIISRQLTNSQEYPFNNSKTNISLSGAYDNTDYIVIPEILSVTGGFAGNVLITNKTVNGFDAEYTGSAGSVNVKFFIQKG